MTHSERYMAAAHAMQSGVAMEMSLEETMALDNINDASPTFSATTPKHLRVGINCAMSDAGGLAKLLIDKGVFTLDEYECAMADAMEREKAKYERVLSDRLGREVKLA